jgi:hypothetical protein
MRLPSLSPNATLLVVHGSRGRKIPDPDELPPPTRIDQGENGLVSPCVYREQHRLDIEYLHLLLPNPPIGAGHGIIQGRENRSSQSQESGFGGILLGLEVLEGDYRAARRPVGASVWNSRHSNLRNGTKAKRSTIKCRTGWNDSIRYRPCDFPLFRRNGD